ncbi:dynein regulatory complex protein 9 isoform X2 [Colius striatus]|uniref:dynein regulatory complex protein 9 isoform X2 n=2 Tax=Colius striatus TaxID=57412 RepID=UPI002B1D8969|nr:dynein regulatory complex protein 9 isoform X2 [Colius striatus]
METGNAAASSRKNTETKEMDKLSHMEALMFSVVLEECIDKLSMLGYLMPPFDEDKIDLSHYASDVLTATLKEIEESGTFNSLIEANEREKARTTEVYDLLARKEEGEKQIKSLKKQLQDVKKETEQELRTRDHMIAYLKDTLQEMKAKASIEMSYMKKKTDLQVHQTQKKCRNAEEALEKEIQDLKNKTDEEIRVHMETENFLRRHENKLEEELDYWMDKYKSDTEAKDEELDALKAARAENLEKLQGVTRECQIMEETITRDRAEKAAKRRQLEQDALELKSILKLQAWWRGTMVRRNLGPYQALKKMVKKQLSKQKGKKENPGAKKKS